MVYQLLALVPRPTIRAEALVPSNVANTQASIHAWNYSALVNDDIAVLPCPSSSTGAAVVPSIARCTGCTISARAGVTLACTGIRGKVHLTPEAKGTCGTQAYVSVVHLKAGSSIQAGGRTARPHCLTISSLELRTTLTGVVVQ